MVRRKAEGYTMKLIWNLDGITLYEPTTVTWKEQEWWITGLGRHTRDNRTVTMFTWHATTNPQGTAVQIDTGLGRLGGTWQGPTWNLPLEVAAAARRLL
jgi:hypothetical protein